MLHGLQCSRDSSVFRFIIRANSLALDEWASKGRCAHFTLRKDPSQVRAESLLEFSRRRPEKKP